MPFIFFTDNMADKLFLEKCFPSLLDDVIPVEKYQNLERLVIPENVLIFVKNSASAINDAMRTIIDDLPSNDVNAKIAVGFDSEWNVETLANGTVIHRGNTAIIQVAYKDRIYILQVSNSPELVR